MLGYLKVLPIDNLSKGPELYFLYYGKERKNMTYCRLHEFRFSFVKIYILISKKNNTVLFNH